jgi:hypothetical protein
MIKNNFPNVTIYTLDENNCFLDYDQNFLKFAYENDWSSPTKPEHLIGTSIFDEIDGIETKYLYQLLFEKCREGKSIGPITFRCDAPSKRRFCELWLDPLPKDHINVISKVIREEKRDTVREFMHNIEKSDKFIRMCSMCKKVDVGDDKWVEVEEAIKILKYFENENQFQITHSLCKPCYNKTMKLIKGA